MAPGSVSSSKLSAAAQAVLMRQKDWEDMNDRDRAVIDRYRQRHPMSESSNPSTDSPGPGDAGRRGEGAGASGSARKVLDNPTSQTRTYLPPPPAPPAAARARASTSATPRPADARSILTVPSSISFTDLRDDQKAFIQKRLREMGGEIAEVQQMLEQLPNPTSADTHVARERLEGLHRDMLRRREELTAAMKDWVAAVTDMAEAEARAVSAATEIALLAVQVNEIRGMMARPR